MITKMRTIYGSHLYGTNTPTSDEDFIEVYVPTLEAMLLGEKVKTIAEIEKEDVRKVAVHTFVRDFIEGQTYALEIAFSPDLEKADERFRDMVLMLRKECLNKDLDGAIGYTLAQAKQNSFKGVKLQHIENVLKIISGLDGKLPFRYAKHLLPTDGEHTRFVIGSDKCEYYQVFDKMIPMGVTIGDAIKILYAMHEKLGKRAKMAQESGHDFKAIMHALRVIGQVYELLTTFQITFPRPEKELLLQIREGKIPMEQVQTYINTGLKIVEVAKSVSTLPTKAEVKDKGKKILLDYLKVEYGIQR